MNETKEAELLIDAEGHVLGRLASVVAKQLLQGRRVTVFNIEKAVVRGSWGSIQREWEHKLQLRSVINPFRYSPKWFVRPDAYFRQAVRGMLPARKRKGKDALSLLRVYIGAHAQSAGTAVRVQEAVAEGGSGKAYTLEKISKRFGWKGVVRNG
ncbi:MAG: 50S ribosomal protein L13 [Thermoprotei archaeon]